VKTLSAILIVAALGGCLMPGDCAGRDMAAEIALNRQWVERVFAASAAAPSRADTLTIAHEDVAGDTKLGRCAFGGPLRLGDRTYARGIGVNAHAVLRLSLTKPAARLRATIGLDRNVDGTQASARFRVQAGDTVLFATEVMRAGAPPREVDLALGGATELDLIVDDGGDGRGWDQGDWADARVCLEDGSELWLDDLARRVTAATELPFSFVYGGRHSSEFLGTWERSATTETLAGGTLRQTVTLADPATGLRVQTIALAYADTPGADWTLHFTNTGAADTPAIEQVRALDATVALGLGGPVTLHRLHGSLCQTDDWLPFDQAVAPGQVVEMATSDGRSSSISPFYTVDWGGGGVVTAIGWSGQWTAVVELRDGKLRNQAGMQGLHLVLHPGETIRSPRVLQMYWSDGDVERAHNLFRQTMLAHVVPRRAGAPALPPIAHLSTSFYELNATNEGNVLSHLRALQGLGFEVFWLDAYWTGPSGFPESMGNYGLPLESVEPPDRFPHGLASIGQAVHDAGLGFLMWFEPERVAPGTRLSREHPEWVISPGNDGSGLLNLGIPAAREYMTAYLNAAIREYRLSWLRIDYNIAPLSFWQHVDARDADRVGLAEIRYVEGLYRLWDDLLAANPGLRLDNCASGGRRIDLETCARATALWRSDNTCDMVGADAGAILNAAVKNQLMSAGLNRYVPFSIVGQMGADPYRFRSGFNGGIAFAEDVRPADYPRQLLRQGIAEGQRLRPYWLGDFYPLSEVTAEPRDWCVMQYHRPETEDGIVLGFRRHRSPYSGYQCAPRGIVADARYDVRVSFGYAPEPTVQMAGDDLQRLELVIRECPGSVLVEYRRVVTG
jgi:alpha-galactosidase